MKAEINDFRCESQSCPFLVQRMRWGCDKDPTHNTNQGHSEDYCNFYKGWIIGNRTIPECEVDTIIMKREI